MRKNYQQILKYALLFSLVCVLFACKKSKPAGEDEPEPGIPDPIKTEKGIPLGTAVQKVIDAAGGTLSTPDGAISVTIPAGAVSAATNFSIQPITNTLQKSKMAFRLSPEGTTFSKPVTVTFHYTEEDFENSAEDALIVAWQTAEGAWKTEPTVLNKANKTLTVTTTHFSDWASSEGYGVTIEKDVLNPGESTFIKVFAITSDDDDGLLAPLTPDYGMGGLTSISNWKVEEGPQGKLDIKSVPGKGNLQYEATYTAPTSITGVHDVVVTVEIRGKINIKDPQAPGGVRQMGQMFLYAPFKIAGNYMIGKFGGTDLILGHVEAQVGNGKTVIIGHSEDGLTSVSLTTAGTVAGGYSCGDLLQSGTSMVWATLPQAAYMSQYEECGPPHVVKYSGGKVIIDKIGNVGEMVEGSFAGTLYQPDGPDCKFKSETLNVTFRALRTQ